MNCPTCGSPVKVVGKTTKHYEPVSRNRIPKEDEMEQGSKGRWLGAPLGEPASVTAEDLERLQGLVDEDEFYLGYLEIKEPLARLLTAYQEQAEA